LQSNSDSETGETEHLPVTNTHSLCNN